jgi:tetratricopeptide (TPR) repeat protein
VVERAGQFDEETLLFALDEAVTARVLSEVGGPAPRYRFSHALVRATLYEELTDAGRVVLHRRVAEAMESLYSGRLDDLLPALAHHYARASIPQADAGKAASYAQRAGDRALVQLANDEAVAYYRQALEILDLVDGDAVARMELLISLGEAQRRAGDAAHRETLLTAARLAQENGDASALARAALANNRGFFSVAGKLDQERLSVLDAAVASAPPGDDGVRARLLANLAGELMFSTDHERRDRLADEALAMARRLGDAATLGHVLAHRMPVLAQTRTEEHVACLEGLEAAASTLPDPVLTFMSTWWRSVSALTVGDAREAARRLDAAARLASELKQPFHHWAVGYMRCNLSRIAGDLALAESQAMDAFEIGRSAGIPDAFRVMGINLFWIRHDQGRLAELAEPIARAAARDRGQGLYLAVLAFVHSQLDGHAEAREIIDSLAADDFTALPSAFLSLYSLTVAATACAAVGDRASALVLYDRLRPWGGLVAHGCACATGTVAHHLGLLAGVLTRYEVADQHFAQAAALNERIGAPTWQAWTRLEWARTLVERGEQRDTVRARELLGLAMVTAGELGMSGVVTRAEDLLAEVE